MPLTWRENDLFMKWCLECHREPERFVRPREHVFDMEYQRPNDPELGQKLVHDYGIENRTACSYCHY
jgi:hypothetical protein